MRRTFFAAVTFLTRLPSPSRAAVTTDDLAAAVPWFPAVGALIGLLTIGVLLALRVVIGANGPSISPQLALLTAALLVAFDAWLTRALHLDGLADCADGFGGGWTREDVLRIMRDHSVGAFGATALVVTLAVKTAAIAALLRQPSWRLAGTLVAVPMVARWTGVVLLRWQPYARRSAPDNAPAGAAPEALDGKPGIAARLGASLAPRHVAISTIATAFAAFAMLGSTALVIFACAGAVCGYWGRTAGRRISGITGDVLGACIVTTEAVLFSVLALGSH